MKPIFCFPLIFLSLVLAATRGLVRGQDVLDTAGNPVEVGVPYYIIPAQAGISGGVVPSSRTFKPDELCPLDAVLSALPFVPGLPVTFTVPNDTYNSLPLDTNVNIQFETGVWLCPQSKIWKVESIAEHKDYFHVTTGGEIGGGLSDFKITSYEGDAYRLDFCDNGPICFAVGTYKDENGIRRLAINNDILAVRFQKVSEAIVHADKTMLRMFPSH